MKCGGRGILNRATTQYLISEVTSVFYIFRFPIPSQDIVHGVYAQVAQSPVFCCAHRTETLAGETLSKSGTGSTVLWLRSRTRVY